MSSTDVAVPGVEESKVRFECVLEEALEVNHKDSVTVDLIIGKIVMFHIDEAIYESGRINYERLRAISRLAGSDYAQIGKTFSIERPQ